MVMIRTLDDRRSRAVCGPVTPISRVNYCRYLGCKKKQQRRAVSETRKGTENKFFFRLGAVRNADFNFSGCLYNQSVPRGSHEQLSGSCQVASLYSHEPLPCCRTAWLPGVTTVALCDFFIHGSSFSGNTWFKCSILAMSEPCQSESDSMYFEVRLLSLAHQVIVCY